MFLMMKSQKWIYIYIYIEEVSYEPLKCLEGKLHDPDAVNLLAKRLCSLTRDEVNKFEAVRELNGISDLYDMINLTENMHYYTLVKDMSDITAVGKLHIMTRDGGISTEDINNIDFESIGKKLIESGNGRITRYGNIYTNSDLEYYEPCTRESLPPFQFYDNQPVCVEMSYKDNANYVYLPDTRMAFEMAAFRMGARDVSNCKCKVDFTEFNVSHTSEPKAEFVPPELSKNMHRTFAYLIKTRKIDADIVQHFVNEKKIVETAKHHNVAFCGYDENGEMKQMHLRSTIPGNRFFMDIEGSDKQYYFHHIGTSENVYVFEAPIDMLSYITLNKENW